MLFRSLKPNPKPLKTLVLGHGHAHPIYHHIPITTSILLDINPKAQPDILGDMRSMHRLPDQYFDAIYVLYTPVPGPIAKSNHTLWTHSHRILKTGGKLYSNYIMHYFLTKKTNIVTAKNALIAYFSKIFRSVTINSATVVLTK